MMAKYSLNIFAASRNVSFIHLANLFHPKTVDACFENDGNGEVGGIKTEDNQWNLAGHRHRLINVEGQMLSLFAKLYDDPGTPSLQARLPVLHSQQLQSVLNKFASTPKRLVDFNLAYFTTVMWDETNSVKKDGTIRRDTCFPENITDLVMSGPHFNVGTPLYKTPRRICTEKAHYDCLDLTNLPDNYLPRTNYCPDLSKSEYISRIPTVTWGEKKSVTNFYRIVTRKMLSQAGARTLISSIIPPGTAHIHGCISHAFSNLSYLVNIASLFSSIPFDFFVKTTGRSNFMESTAEQLPFLDNDLRRTVRILSLNCLTTHYAELWNECWKNEFKEQIWTKDDPKLDKSFFKNLTSDWQITSALRSDYSRRQALLEIDVLVAQALKLTLDEFLSIFQVQFPVMQQNENETWFDQNGRIIFTTNKGLTGVGLSRRGKGHGLTKEIGWEDVIGMASGSVELKIIDDTLSSGQIERTITYEAPFTRCNRIEDYKIAWNFFEKGGSNL